MFKKNSEPIAIVGMACRFPGAEDIEAFWRLLHSGRNAVTEGVLGSGAGRVGQLFPDDKVNSACRFAGFLDRLDEFDASFFRISPVEAQRLDPQQRMMLETSWQALEDAGIDPDRLKGSRTGVYAGISNYDYRALVLDAGEPTEPAASLYSVTGTSFNTAIGRVAFALGLNGPAMALDTACSSSLVAIHQAVSGLQREEADLALAGGVHVILSAQLFEMRANAGMLSPDGRCATFDAGANGYVRGEGCGILVLKRLSEAVTDGDRIWAVIRSTAVNQDGATPGLTVPSQDAQERCIEDALLRAGLEPSDVDYVEAHGTGTEVGDPIEARATAAAYGKGREPDHPILIGSVKTNIGHLEAAAGVAGVIKAVLSIERRTIPKHLHFENPNPEVDWDRIPLRVTGDRMEWPLHSGRAPRAGVSGFGWSGTNAHVLLEGYETADRTSGEGDPNGRRGPVGSALPVAASPAEAGADPASLPALREEELSARVTRVLPLSGRSDEALRELAERYLDWVDEGVGETPAGNGAGDPLLADMAWTAGVGRSHFDHRAGVLFRDAATLREGLRKIAGTEEKAAPRRAATVAFAYAGQASQWPGMGATLYASEPVVRAVLDRCDEWLREERDASLLDVMFGRPATSGDLDDPQWKQPAIYALECALGALWSSLGIRPDVVLGHSLGEIAAARAAGVFGLEDGLRLAAVRGSLIGALPGEGAMAAVFAPAARVAEALEAHNAASRGIGLCIAADNGAHQVISGPAADVDAILERLEAAGVRVARLRKSPAYHSAMIEPALDDLEEALSQLAFAPPSLPFVSNLTGRVVGSDEALDAAYWRRQMRAPVAFRSCVETLAGLGVDAVVEIGPHAVLGPMTTLAWPESAGTASPPAALSSLMRPGRNVSATEAEDAFFAAVAGAYEAGLPLRFDGLFAGESRRRISLPGYPFRRDRHWVDAPRRRRSSADHPLLGSRHESASGEISFDTELFPSDPAWLDDHRVFDRVVAPGALYGTMAAAACTVEDPGPAVVEDFQMHSALVFPESGDADDGAEEGRRLQLLLDGAEEGGSRRVRILSRGSADEEWTLHAEGRVSAGADSDLPPAGASPDPARLKSGLAPVDLAAYYRAKAAVGIGLGPSFRTVEALWAGPGEALGEVSLPDSADRGGLAFHPLVLDGCFQAMGAARGAVGSDDDVTYLPFGWERLSVPERLPERLLCHVRMREAPDGADAELPEVLSADIALYELDGSPVGTLDGYTVKRATRSALLPAVEGVEELLYEIVWRDRALPPGMPPADFLPSPSAAASRSQPFSRYLAAEGVKVEDETGLQEVMERAAWCYALSALETLGWERRAGAAVEPEKLRERLEVLPEHANLLRRMLEILARSGVLQEKDEGFVVTVGAEEPLPDRMPGDSEAFLTEVTERFPHAANEIGLFRRCAGALPEVLRGNEDPLSLLFGDAEPTAGDLYRLAPVWRAANRMIGEVVRSLVDELPDDRRLRVLEVGAGIGSATEYVLPELPAGRFDYVYTDISAGFFAEAETRFSADDTSIDYRVLDIEKDPMDQGFDPHGYDLVIAANVLHATRHLDETLAHCGALLAPSGLLVALENQRGRGWMDLIFGQLDGWWRFDDRYRSNHALAGPEVWRRALADTGFAASEVLGLDVQELAGLPDRGVIVAQSPAEIALPEGAWILAADRGGMAAALAAELAAQNQRVVLAGDDPEGARPAAESEAGIVATAVEMDRRESWQALVEGLPSDVPFAGAVHLVAQDGCGTAATTAEMAGDAKRAAASALALVQGIADADAAPEKGVWFVTRGAQVLERERTGQLAGSPLWGFGRVVAREAPQLQPRMVDLDPEAAEPQAVLADELLFPDAENHIAHRGERRQVPRLVRTGDGVERLALPEETNWVLAPDEGGAIETLRVQPLAPRALEPREVRAEVEACGLNFLDVFRAMGLVEDEGMLGEEFCGRIVETGADVTAVSVGDRVAGFAFGTFGPEVVTREELVALAPPDVSATALATIPSVFVTCVLSYELAGLEAGDCVLIHAGAGGVGLAAIQLAQAAGAEVFATASAPKRGFLRSLGVEHVFDSRSTAFGQEILDATGGAGIDVVLNSLTGEGFIEASLACLSQGGRFVELARRDILSHDEMAALRPDVAYSILDLYTLKEQAPAGPGGALRDVLARMTTGELAPLRHTTWPLAETSAAMGYMRAARHIGKIVLTTPPLAAGRLRRDGTYLVTGGLGGIGLALAEWLAERGAGTVVLNGRRAPDAAAERAIETLRARGFRIEVELADVTDTDALDAMLERMDGTLPPLSGVIHSVGVLSDAALGNQNWESFETVLWPKMLGAWHLHRATAERDLDMFVLFSSVAGVLGNPGQANHAAANAFLDQLAAHRRALGLPGQSIAWGAWSGLGEAEEQRERIAGRREASGTGWFPPEQGFLAFERLLREDATGGVVAVVDWPVFGESVGGRPPLLEDLLAVATDDDDASSSDDLLAQLGATPAAERENLLVSFVQREVQAVLRLPSAPAPTVGFFDLGMDSLMAVELRNRLNRAFSDTYVAPNTLVFDYPTIADLASHLVDALGEAASEPGESALAAGSPPEPAPQPVAREDDGIAVVGMACRFPGAPDLQTFWSQLEAGRDAVTNGRQDNGSWTGIAGDPAAGDDAWGRGGFVEEIDRFDARFFGMTPIGTRMMDPQQRLLLETSWQALEDAGIDLESLRGSGTGVYAGISTSEYRDLMMTAGGEGLNYLGTASSMALGGVAFKLGLMGPTMPVVLNCAASLVAVHHAATALQQGEVDLALVGGVNALFSLGLTREMVELGLLSPQGLCKTFDASADGFVRGEGCGMVVLKRLHDAEADGDRIWGVIRGTAVNQNGATAGPTVPNGRAQQQVIREALGRAGVAPGQVDYLEAHGGASTLGDPIEVQAAAAVYGEGREASRPLLVGSVKTNIGHLESAAGIAGLIKVMLSMKQGVIPKHLHFTKPNEHVDWDALPVQVTSESMRWPRDPDRPPSAGVSAFGISGTNAHVVVEGYQPPDDVARENGAAGPPAGAARTIGIALPESLAELPPPSGDFDARTARVLPLSGKSDKALRELAERYLAWLDTHADHLDAASGAGDSLLSDMAWTAGVGRDHFPYRAGVAFQGIGSLRKGLHAVAAADGTMSSRTADAAATPPKLAFSYAGEDTEWTEMGKRLHRTEPVVRAVLDRCDEILQDERGGTSLLDVLFGSADAKADVHDPAWSRPATFAFECAVTALWSSVGVRPGVVSGRGVGELAAAWTAGVVDLEDGLRISSRQGMDGMQAAASGITLSPPALSILNQESGQVVGPEEIVDGAYWRDPAHSLDAPRHRAEGLAGLDVDLILEIGPGSGLGPTPLEVWPNGADQVADTLAEWVARVYAAGIPVSFAGLFAGESRRRISIPGYPFQRKRYWLDVLP
ncbi:SDR family NAD(P)-dependent oxidoreductase [Candidatus Palauibacter sp.]|uniref:SDR family NAD(P)-dependent oxidoreductase n=1 Tax=Candidatus Palauibacter sp. TaxID=3101350 RepID=UPI003D0D79EC